MLLSMMKFILYVRVATFLDKLEDKLEDENFVLCYLSLRYYIEIETDSSRKPS